MELQRSISKRMTQAVWLGILISHLHYLEFVEQAEYSIKEGQQKKEYSRSRRLPALPRGALRTRSVATLWSSLKHLLLGW